MASLTRLLSMLGDATVLVGDGKTASLPTAKMAAPSIHRDRWVRNRKHPNATLMNAMNEAANASAIYRSKEVFSAGDVIASFRSIASVSTDRARWRFAFHTGPLTHSLYAVVIMRPPNSTYDHNSYTRLDIADSTGTIVSSKNFVYGTSPTGGAGNDNALAYLKVCSSYIDGLDPDSDYYGVFVDVDYGRIQSATVFDLQSLSEHYDGYLSQNLGTHSAIKDTYRSNIATLLYNLWRRGAAQVFNWSVNDGTAPQTNATTTFKNCIDTAVASVSTASPGYTINMYGKDRVSQPTGVPVVMKVCAANGVTGAATGTVKLVNSAGVTVMSITDGWSTTASSPNWQSVSGVLPATTDKYDIQFNNNGSGTLSLYAVSVFEYE